MVLGIQGQVVEPLPLGSRNVDESDVLQRLTEGRARNEADQGAPSDCQRCQLRRSDRTHCGVRSAFEDLSRFWTLCAISSGAWSGIGRTELTLISHRT